MHSVSSLLHGIYIKEIFILVKFSNFFIDGVEVGQTIQATLKGTLVRVSWMFAHIVWVGRVVGAQGGHRSFIVKIDYQGLDIVEWVVRD
jgi:hypothetical protein